MVYQVIMHNGIVLPPTCSLNFQCDEEQQMVLLWPNIVIIPSEKNKEYVTFLFIKFFDVMQINIYFY